MLRAASASGTHGIHPLQVSSGRATLPARTLTAIEVPAGGGGIVNVATFDQDPNTNASLYGTGLDFSSVFPRFTRVQATIGIGTLAFLFILIGRLLFDLLGAVNAFVGAIVVTTTPWMIILATIPVGIAGLALEHAFRVYFSKPVPTARTKGVLVAPTVYGNVLLGPTVCIVRTTCSDREDHACGPGARG